MAVCKELMTSHLGDNFFWLARKYLQMSGFLFCDEVRRLVCECFFLSWLLQVYHSSFVDDEQITKACGCPLLPLKSHIKGPAPVSDQGYGWNVSFFKELMILFYSRNMCNFYADRTDIVDEAITFFRANVFFTNFDIKSSADKLLIYLTFYINVALKRLEGCRTLAEGTKAIINLGLENVPVPGESGFPFPGLFTLPQSKREAGKAPWKFFVFVIKLVITYFCLHTLRPRKLQQLVWHNSCLCYWTKTNLKS